MSHAVLSPSASGRWLQCPASVRMLRNRPPEEPSVFAIEGTLFHTLCEIKVSERVLGLTGLTTDSSYLDWLLEIDQGWLEDQLQYVEDYVNFIQECLDEEPGATLLLEQRVDTGVPGCWGTADAVIIYKDRIRVIDVKYGAGQRVSAIENSQLMFYGLGGLSLVEDPLSIHEITMTIWQPRMDNISDFTMTRTELVKWREDIIPRAQLALSEDAPFGPSEDACRWCPIAGECVPRMNHILENDFGDPNLMDGEQMAEAYGRVSELKKWLADVEDMALKRAYEDEGSVPGYKVVRSGGRRTITDGDKAIDALTKAGFELADIAVTKPAALGKLDKLVGGKDELQQILGDTLVLSEGRLSLASEEDPRPAADAQSSAENDFAGITE